MQKLIILRGNSGSGKSSTAKRLQKNLGYETMLIPQDVVRREILGTQDLPNNHAIQLIHDLATYGIKIGYDVIIEGIMTEERYGVMLRSLLDNFEGETYVYYFDITFEETLNRHNKKTNRHEFGEAEMRQWWIEKDTLKYPNEQLLTNDMSELDIDAKILNDLET
ncbi:hypothetical protein EON76_02995 [bacterium]|nr:MAG: hypothetical protein EON76_02995 [bacterium]